MLHSLPLLLAHFLKRDHSERLYLALDYPTDVWAFLTLQSTVDMDSNYWPEDSEFEYD